MKKMKKQKSERLMSKKEQIRRLSKLLSSRGVYFSREEMSDLVDPTLHYGENKKSVTAFYGATKTKRITDANVILDQARSLHARRPIRAQVMDNNIKSKKVFTINDLVKDTRKADLWFGAPNRYDIKGVDYKPTKTMKITSSRSTILEEQRRRSLIDEMMEQWR